MAPTNALGRVFPFHYACVYFSVDVDIGGPHTSSEEDQLNKALFDVGVRVRIREVRGSPRPPAQWLGKKGNIRELLADPLASDEFKEAPKRPKHDKVEERYLVEVESPIGVQAIRASWLAAD